MSIASADLKCRVTPQEQLLLNYVESAAHLSSRPVRPLHLQALLQLPRLADRHGLVSGLVIEDLLAELVQELPARSEWLVREADSSPRDLHFHEVDPGTATNVMQRFHYLRSPRQDGRAYGLSTRAGSLVGICVSSPLDVVQLCELLVSRGRTYHSARMVSRVFVFEGAPSNSISYMLSRVAREERHLGVTDLVTYVNPNMGFSGSSYLASGWCFLGTEPGTKYRYIDDRYTTDREIVARFGSIDGMNIRLLGHRFAESIMPLEPLLVFQTALVH